MPESHWGHRWLAKAVIVLIVFPVVMFTLLQAWKLLVLALASVAPATT
jgi:hypothetical protein